MWFYAYRNCPTKGGLTVKEALYVARNFSLSCEEIIPSALEYLGVWLFQATGYMFNALNPKAESSFNFIPHLPLEQESQSIEDKDHLVQLTEHLSHVILVLAKLL